MSELFERRGQVRQAEYEAQRAEALRLGLVLVPTSAKRYVVVNFGPSRLERNYDPIPGGSVSETLVNGRSYHYLRGAVVCGPAAYDDCLVYIKDWLAARGAKP
jgi:hypothetical protein